MHEDQPTWATGVVPDGADDHPGRQRPPRVFPWGPWATVAWTLAIAGVTFVGVGFAAGFLAGLQIATDPSAGSFPDVLTRVAEEHLAGLTLVQAVISAGLVVPLTRAVNGVGRARMLGLEPIGLRRLAAAAAAILVAIFLLTEVPQLIFNISDRPALKWITELSPQWLALLLIVVAAPVSEEVIFRGFIYGGLARSTLGPLGAVVLTSAVWAVVHVQYSWPIMLQIFIYGLVFGIARWRTGSLWPSIVAHALINLYAAFVAYWTFGTSA